APDIAGQGIANPSAQMLAAAMLLDHIGELEAGDRLRRALETAIVKDNVRTKDLGGSASTTEFARAVVRRLSPPLRPLRGNHRGHRGGRFLRAMCARRHA